MTAVQDIGLRTAVEEDVELGEFVIAEYITFLLAVDTYIRYVEETTGEQDPTDDVIRKAERLLRIAESEAERMTAFLLEHLSTQNLRQMAIRAFQYRVIQVSGIGNRALKIRTLLRNPTTMRKIFETNRAIRLVREAVASSMLDDADAALDKFASALLKNVRFKAWIKLAAQTAGSGEVPRSPVEEVVDIGTPVGPDLLKAQIDAVTATGAEAVQVAAAVQKNRLERVRTDATQAAKDTLEARGETDAPPKKSEVIGTMAAVVEEALSNPARAQNIPEPLRRLDDEQRAASLTDGRVLVAAGAGSGKSTTLVARVGYLVQERRVDPSRILVTSFNKKAAGELRDKIGRSVGEESLRLMSVGTMHSLFRRFIGDYGTSREKIAMGVAKEANGFVGTGSAVARTVQRVWAECLNTDEFPVPKLSTVMRYKSQWAGNNITPAQARGLAKGQEEVLAAQWYEMYEGLKGAIPGWRPPCRSSENKAYESFMARKRPNGIRLGDFDDMLGIYRDILKREPGVRKAVQAVYDHILVDECQDLNSQQHEILEMMSEHITDGSDGKSLWMVGDPNQSIYSFRGARPDLLVDLNEKPGWVTRSIRTNYRCQPEIVETANRLIAHNENRLPMTAIPSSAKAQGVASIVVDTPEDDAAAALDVVEEIKAALDVSGTDVSDHAVLCRTNKEIHAYETACIIRGVPYARKGASSFLGSPETKTFLSYVQLVTGTDFAKMQKSLEEVINRPNRFFVAPEKAAEAVQNALDAYARLNRLDLKAVNPIQALQDSRFVETLVFKLVGIRGGFKFNKGIEKVQELASELVRMQANTLEEKYTTKDLFDDILGLRGIVGSVDPRTGRSVFVEQSFRESLRVDLRDAVSEDDETGDEGDEEDDETKGLGNIAFLYKLAEPDPTDASDLEAPPITPLGFKSKIERYAARTRELRVDIDKWDREQATLPPDQRRPPPAVFLGTAHSTKGAQWKTCFVQMPKGKFPFEPRVKPGQIPDPEELEAQMESERRLAYVALTRAASNLTIVCPKVVGGKAAGVSPFVDEAQLTTGQNVPKAATTAESAEVKTAAEKAASWAEDF